MDDILLSFLPSSHPPNEPLFVGYNEFIGEEGFEQLAEWLPSLINLKTLDLGE
jgi:hypothetical protein